jgi:hypothetical protein
MVALAIVTSLSFAGARPAAAANLDFLNQLSRLWTAVTGLSTSVVAHPVSARAPKLPTKSTSQPANGDRGWGVDPNGNTISSTPSDPLGGN